MLGSGINPESFKLDYSGMANAAATQAQGMANLGANIGDTIAKVGETNKGLPIYTYKYKGDDTTQMGVMAQDVEKKTPKAVKEVGGFKAVNYKLVK